MKWENFVKNGQIFKLFCTGIKMEDKLPKKGSVVHWTIIWLPEEFVQITASYYMPLLEEKKKKNPGICRWTDIWEKRRLNRKTPILLIMQIVTSVNLILHTHSQSTWIYFNFDTVFRSVVCSFEELNNKKYKKLKYFFLCFLIVFWHAFAYFGKLWLTISVEPKTWFEWNKMLHMKGKIVLYHLNVSIKRHHLLESMVNWTLSQLCPGC